MVQRWISGVSGKALAVLVLGVVAACGGSAGRLNATTARGTTSPPASSSARGTLPGTLENVRIYPIKMEWADGSPAAGQFGQGFRPYRVSVIVENRFDRPLGLAEGKSGLFVTGNGPKFHIGFQLVSSDPYTYSNALVEPVLPGHYVGDGGYARIIPPGFSDALPLIFGVAVTAQPAFSFSLVPDSGSSIAVPAQPAPTGPQLPAGVLTAVGQPLRSGSLTATLGSVGPTDAMSDRQAEQQLGVPAASVLADHPQLHTYPWLKGSWTITNSGGQNDYAAMSAYLVTPAGIIHPEELASFLNCCSVAPGQTKTVPSFWAMQQAETTGPAYVVLLAVPNNGPSVTAIWKVR